MSTSMLMSILMFTSIVDNITDIDVKVNIDIDIKIDVDVEVEFWRVPLASFDAPRSPRSEELGCFFAFAFALAEAAV